MSYILAITGGRHYVDREHIYRVLDKIHLQHQINLLVHGACHVRWPVNADGIAEDWARTRYIAYTGVPANWGEFNSLAGPIRNSAMLKDYGVVALVAFPGGKGTNGCMNIAAAINKAAGSTVIELYDERNYVR